jgi:CRISPR-associated protein Csx10
MHIEMTLHGDATFGAGPRGNNTVRSLGHIPGSVLRGAFAAEWIRCHGQPAGNRDFQQLFEGGVRFGPLFNGSPPLPLSIKVHKRGHHDAICHRAWWDTALGDGRDLVECPDCLGPLEMSKGKLPEDTPMRSRTHVALTDSETAVDRALYTRGVVSARQPVVFHGEIAGPTDLTAQLTPLTTLRVGGRRTTGGAATVRQIPDGPRATPQRLGNTLVLRLASPGVFVDAYGRPRREPDLVALGALLHSKVSIERSWVRWTTATGGWHIASGLPKPVDVAVAAGSTYLLQTDGTVSDDDLQALVDHGVGLRRHEGFGALAQAPLSVRTARACDAESERRRSEVQADSEKFAALRDLKRQILVPVCTELRGLARQRRMSSPGESVPTSSLDRLIGTPGVPEYLRNACIFLMGIDDGDLLDAFLDDIEGVNQP